MAVGQVDSSGNRKLATREGGYSPLKLAAVAIVAIVMTSLALAYLCTDVFDELTERATIQVHSICYSEDVQYEISISNTGVILASGTLVSNGSEIHMFEGFDEMGITLRYSVFPGQDFESPFLLSDGEVLQVNIFRLGSVGWQHSY